MPKATAETVEAMSKRTGLPPDMAHTFSFDLLGDPATALTRAEAVVRTGGGTFTGDATRGSFAGSTAVGAVRGHYRVAGDRVTVEITQKPFIVPKAVVESKVREFFGV